MAKTELTKRIEQRLSYYRPKELGDYKLNYMRDHYDMYEVPVTHGAVQDGLIDYVWLAEGFTNIRQEPYCSAPKYINWGLFDCNCKCTSEDFIKIKGKSPIIDETCTHCRYKRLMVKQDDTPAVICFEIKVSKADFHSSHGHNFIGNLNYYVMPIELYKEIGSEIPPEIGCIVFSSTDKQDTLRKRKDAIWREIEPNLYSSMLLTAMNKYRKEWTRTTQEQRTTVGAYYSIIDSLLKENMLLKRDSAERPLCFIKNEPTEFMQRNPQWYSAELSECNNPHGAQSNCEDCVFNPKFTELRKKKLGLSLDKFEF